MGGGEGVSGNFGIKHLRGLLWSLSKSTEVRVVLEGHQRDLGQSTDNLKGLNGKQLSERVDSGSDTLACHGW